MFSAKILHIFLALAVLCFIELVVLQQSLTFQRVANYFQDPSKKLSRVRNGLILQSTQKLQAQSSTKSEKFRNDQNDFEKNDLNASIGAAQPQKNMVGFASTDSSLGNPQNGDISQVNQTSAKSSVQQFSNQITTRMNTTSPSHEKHPRFPQALIIGFSKCGTAALRSFLTLHPDVVSPVLELRYFTQHFSRGRQWYRQQMPPSTEHQLTVEKTPYYIMTNKSLQRIHSFDSHIKLLVIVRDPIVRLQSQYAHEFCHTEPSAKPSFRDYWGEKPNDISVVRCSHYARYIRQVYHFFSRDQVLVLSEDEMERDPLSVLQETEKFLKLRPVFTTGMFVFNTEKGFHCFNIHSPLFPKVLSLIQVNRLTGCLGREKGREHPPIEKDYLKHLKRVIRPLNEELFHLIGKRFHWDNFDEKS